MSGLKQYSSNTELAEYQPYTSYVIVTRTLRAKY